MTLVDLAGCVVLAAIVILAVLVGCVSRSSAYQSSDADFRAWQRRNIPPKRPPSR